MTKLKILPRYKTQKINNQWVGRNSDNFTLPYDSELEKLLKLGTKTDLETKIKQDNMLLLQDMNGKTRLSSIKYIFIELISGEERSLTYW